MSTGVLRLKMSMYVHDSIMMHHRLNCEDSATSVPNDYGVNHALDHFDCLVFDFFLAFHITNPKRYVICLALNNYNK